MLVSCETHWVRRKDRVLRQPEVTPIFLVGKETLLRVKGVLLMIMLGHKCKLGVSWANERYGHGDQRGYMHVGTPDTVII